MADMTREQKIAARKRFREYWKKAQKERARLRAALAVPCSECGGIGHTKHWHDRVRDDAPREVK